MLSKADKVRKNTLIFISDNKPTIFSICQFSDFCLPVILFKFWPFFFLFGKAYKSFSLFPRIAVMYAPQSGFCYGTSNPRGPLAVKIRHLKFLGYNSVLVRLWHLQKIMSHSHFCTISAYFTSKPFCSSWLMSVFTYPNLTDTLDLDMWFKKQNIANVWLHCITCLLEFRSLISYTCIICLNY